MHRAKACITSPKTASFASSRLDKFRHSQGLHAKFAAASSTNPAASLEDRTFNASLAVAARAFSQRLELFASRACDVLFFLTKKKPDLLFEIGEKILPKSKFTPQSFCGFFFFFLSTDS